MSLPALPRPTGLTRAALLLVCGLGCTAALAQDAQRWHEVEVVVFTHEDRASQVSERPLADPSRLGWLPRLTTLASVAERLYFPFAPLQRPESLLDPAPPTLPAVLPAVAPSFGPQPAPLTSRSFRLLDQARDPFLALDDRVALLDQDARRLAGSAQHRVLWHGTWRQPLLPAGRAQAVFVAGGDVYGDRHELEGSLRVSDSGGRAQLELHLWFSSFLAGFSTAESAWSLPPLPLLQSSDSSAAEGNMGRNGEELGSWMSSGTWQLRDNALLTLDATHYFDNPAIGVIVQIRPYSVPPRELPGTVEDF